LDFEDAFNMMARVMKIRIILAYEKHQMKWILI